MTTRLITLDDGLLVEVEADVDMPQRISARSAKKVEEGLTQVQDLLSKTVKPVASVWDELNRDLAIDQVEIELKLGFSAEGNLFIARGTGTASLGFKLIVKPAGAQSTGDTAERLDKNTKD